MQGCNSPLRLRIFNVKKEREDLDTFHRMGKIAGGAVSFVVASSSPDNPVPAIACVGLIAGINTIAEFVKEKKLPKEEKL